MRRFYDSCESYLRGLEALSVTTNTCSTELIPILLKKSPKETRRLLILANNQADSCLEDLRSTVRKEIETRERSQTSITQEPTPPTADEKYITTASQF